MERIVGTISELSAKFFELSMQAVARASAEGRRACIAVSGGSAARALAPGLDGLLTASFRRPTDLVEIFLADERAVPASDPESNYGLLKRLLGNSPRWKLHPLFTGKGSLDEQARAYAQQLQALAPTSHGGTPLLDLVLLGVGEDGHVASLFPQHPGLKNQDIALAVADAPKAPAARLSLGLGTLKAARSVVVAAFGEGKAAIVQQLNTPGSDLPVARVLTSAGARYLLLDEAAAGRGS